MILEQLNNLLKNDLTAVNDWFNKAYQNVTPCFYSSVDLRYSGYKLAPIDTNIYPAGFNNLNNAAKLLAEKAIKEYLTQYFPDCQKILLIPESHSRNQFYLDNIMILKSLLEAADKEVNIELIEELELANDKITTKKHFIPDLIILNNDLTTGVPEIFLNASQPFTPSYKLGWHVRRKSNHYAIYDQFVRDFCHQFALDPFFLSTVYSNCDKVNFKTQTGLDCIAIAVEKTIHLLQEKYDNYGIKYEPTVYIKADNGTYGRGILKVNSSEEIYNLNKKARNNMNIIKGGVVNSEVVVQEGVRSIEHLNGNVAEPVVYLIGNQPVHYMYRINQTSDQFANLNSPGMYFENNSSLILPDHGASEISYGLVAKLAALAAAKEIY